MTAIVGVCMVAGQLITKCGDVVNRGKTVTQTYKMTREAGAYDIGQKTWLTVF